MNNEGNILLRKLGSGVIPGDADVEAAASAIENADFPTLLVGALDGAIRTGRAVLVRADLREPLTLNQLQHLADAADLAQAAGALRVVATIDGRALTLDVLSRAVTGEIPLDTPAQLPSEVQLGIDAVVVARPTVIDLADDGEAEANATTNTPISAQRLADKLMQIQNRTVAELLSGATEPQHAR